MRIPWSALRHLAGLGLGPVQLPAHRQLGSAPHVAQRCTCVLYPALVPTPAALSPALWCTAQTQRACAGVAHAPGAQHRPLFVGVNAPVFNLQRQVCGRVALPGDIFNVPVRKDILHRVVRWQRAKAQQGTHKAKNRAEVRGGGRKPWKQKGLGKSRQGSIRAPQWRGGGVVHGPVPRSHAHKLTKKVRRLGLKCALSAKLNEGRLLVVDSLALDIPKTKVMAESCDTLLPDAPRRSILFVDSATNGQDGGATLRRASANLGGVQVVPQLGANVLSILRHDALVLTEGAVELLCARLRAPINRLGVCGRSRAEQP